MEKNAQYILFDDECSPAVKYQCDLM